MLDGEALQLRIWFSLVIAIDLGSRVGRSDTGPVDIEVHRRRMKQIVQEFLPPLWTKLADLLTGGVRKAAAKAENILKLIARYQAN
jgi:hypothetical protein